MQWLQYREQWATGNGNWQYKPMHDTADNPIDDKKIKKIVDEMVKEHSWSDKFLGIEFTLVTVDVVPFDEIDSWIKKADDNSKYWGKTKVALINCSKEKEALCSQKKTSTD